MSFVNNENFPEFQFDKCHFEECRGAIHHINVLKMNSLLDATSMILCRDVPLTVILKYNIIMQKSKVQLFFRLFVLV
jgi:hypothetical protein